VARRNAGPQAVVIIGASDWLNAGRSPVRRDRARPVLATEGNARRARSARWCDNSRLSQEVRFSRSRSFVGSILKDTKGSRVVGHPEILGVGGPTRGDAYAGVSSTMRPSLQLYLASKSAFTVTATQRRRPGP
jgi:hypothetical protein